VGEATCIRPLAAHSRRSRHSLDAAVRRFEAVTRARCCIFGGQPYFTPRTVA
jgi:hypothetical protein